MNESPKVLHVNPGFEDDDKPTSMESVQMKAFRIRTEKKYRHLDCDHGNLYDTLNFKKAKPAQGSNRALLALVIIVCLISLVALLLTLLMFFGIIGPSNKGSDPVSAKTKTFEENMTNPQLDLGKVIYHQTMTPSWIKAHASYIDESHGYTTEEITFYPGEEDLAALFKVPMIPVNALQNSTSLTVKIVISTNVTLGSTDVDSDMMYGVSDGISFVGFEIVDKNNYGNYTPCYGSEGVSSSSRLKDYNYQLVTSSLHKPRDSFYPGQVVSTLKLNERWGSCYTAHDGGFAKIAVYNKRLTLSKGLTFEVYKDEKDETVGIKFVEVTIIQDS